MIQVSFLCPSRPRLSRPAVTDEGPNSGFDGVYDRLGERLLLFSGGLHLWLYTLKGQGTAHKYHPKWFATGNQKRFLFGSQLWDNIIWSVASGCTLWTGYEVMLMWAYANGHAPYIAWTKQPVYFTLILVLLI